MMAPDHPTAPQAVQRRLRLVAILSGAQEAGLSPLPLDDLHNVAYFADALAPVWGLRIVDAQSLKRRSGALSPILQHDLDLLVGRGVVRPSDVSHRLDADKSWRLDARYALVAEPAARILAAARSFEQSASHVEFVIELVHAMSALGMRGIAQSSGQDATYGSSSVDFGSIVDLSGHNASTRVALRFGTLLEDDARLTSAEMIHLYVRELYKRLGHVA
jgi:hypothetical protein